MYADGHRHGLNGQLATRPWPSGRGGRPNSSYMCGSAFETDQPPSPQIIQRVLRLRIQQLLLPCRCQALALRLVPALPVRQLALPPAVLGHVAAAAPGQLALGCRRRTVAPLQVPWGTSAVAAHLREKNEVYSETCTLASRPAGAGDPSTPQGTTPTLLDASCPPGVEAPAVTHTSR